MAAFAAVRREVRESRRVRVLRAMAVTAGIVAVAGAFTINAYGTLIGG